MKYDIIPEKIEVRKDLLEKLYSAIKEQEDSAFCGENITLGNIMEARDNLLAGKTYSERKTK